MLLIDSTYYSKQRVNPQLNYVQPNEGFELRIPKARARGESKDMISKEKIQYVDHYTLYIRNQFGSPYVRKDTDVYFKLPSGFTCRIIIHMDGGASFDSKFHKEILRETDELDRRILLGFCILYDVELKHASHRKLDTWLQNVLEEAALNYTASKMPKRIKSGPKNNDHTEWLRTSGWLEPYDESKIENNNASIFANVRFI